MNERDQIVGPDEVRAFTQKYEAWMGTLPERQRALATALVRTARAKAGDDEVAGYILPVIAGAAGALAGVVAGKAIAKAVLDNSKDLGPAINKVINDAKAGSGATSSS